MKKNIISVVAISLCLFNYSAFAIDANTEHGFYLKGYLGESFSTNENLQVHGVGGYPDPYNDFSNRIGNALLFGGGIGYQFNNLLRTDITYDNRNSFKYDTTFTNSDRHRTFNVNSDTYMVNLYVDAKGISRFNLTTINPYLGVGLGIAHNRTSNYASTAISTSVTNYVSSNTTNSLAWQIMLGSSIDLTKHLQLDLCYRYVALGKIAIGNHSITEPTLKLATLSTNHSGTNELYFGVRYRF